MCAAKPFQNELDVAVLRHLPPRAVIPPRSEHMGRRMFDARLQGLADRSEGQVLHSRPGAVQLFETEFTCERALTKVYQHVKRGVGHGGNRIRSFRIGGSCRRSRRDSPLARVSDGAALTSRDLSL
jgi:hypothetical protein